MKTLALFDFDGTVTTKDTFSKFLIYLMPPFRLIFEALILGPIYLAYTFKLVSNNTAKGLALRRVLRGHSDEQLKKLGQHFYQKHCFQLIRPDAIKKIEWHKSEGHQVVLVSASVAYWLSPFAADYELDLICTKVKIVDGVCLGELDGLNCFGPEKVRRIKEKYNLNEFDQVYAYGDTRGDKEMLEMADLGFFRPFRGKSPEVPIKSWETR